MQMATSKRYGYYVTGGKLSLLELKEDSTDISTESDWKSPQSSVTDGIEFQYVYSPEYRISSENTEDIAQCESYVQSSGYLMIQDAGLGLLDGTSDPVETHIVLRNTTYFDGMHEIKTFDATGATLILNTKYSGPLITEAFTCYNLVEPLQDETFELDVSRYQANAIVYYLQAKKAEQQGELEAKEYFMREFRRILEKYESGRNWGHYQVQGTPLFR